jgi:hypothetical protein
MWSDAVWIGFFTMVPLVFAQIVVLIMQWKASVKLDVLKTSTDGMKDQLVAASLSQGKTEGKAEGLIEGHKEGTIAEKLRVAKQNEDMLAKGIRIQVRAGDTPPSNSNIEERLQK